MSHLFYVGLSGAATFGNWYSFRDPNPNTSEESKSKAEKDVVQREANRFVTYFRAIRAVSIPLGLIQTVALAQQWVRVEDSLSPKVTTGLHVLAVAGFALRLWCYRTLDKYFTFQLSIQEEHKIVKSGPYAWLAHPSYLGLILATLGFGATSGPFTPLLASIPRKVLFNMVLPTGALLSMDLKQLAFYTLTATYAIQVLFSSAILLRIRDEEAMMKRHFGSDYDAVLATRWRIIPGVF